MQDNAGAVLPAPHAARDDYHLHGTTISWQISYGALHGLMEDSRGFHPRALSLSTEYRNPDVTHPAAVSAGIPDGNIGRRPAVTASAMKATVTPGSLTPMLNSSEVRARSAR